MNSSTIVASIAMWSLALSLVGLLALLDHLRRHPLVPAPAAIRRVPGFRAAHPDHEE